MSYPITDIEGIDDHAVSVLKSVGIRSTGALLEAASTVKGRKLLSIKTEIGEKQLLWGQCRRSHAHQGHQQGIRRAFAGSRRRYGERTQISQPRQSREIDRRGEPQAQDGAAVALAEGHRALDRARQEPAAEDHVLRPRLLDSLCGTPQTRPLWPPQISWQL